jgi:flavodoxin
MNKEMIIIYGSCYGTTEKYAKELSKRLGCEAVSYEDVRDINAYKIIIYLGGLYAGGVQGMKKTLKKLKDISDKKVYIVTVGLADPKNEGNIENIRKKMRSQV